MGWDSGILTLNQALDMLNLPPAKEDGEERKDLNPVAPGSELGTLPLENSQEGKPTQDS